MTRAVKCPVCEGSGTYKTSGNDPIYDTCHGCNGKGWVELANVIVGPRRGSSAADMASLAKRNTDAVL